MDKLKQHWFAALNGGVFLAVLLYYFLIVPSIRSDIKKEEQLIARSRSELSSLASKKPSKAWLGAVEEAAGVLAKDIKELRDELKKSDLEIEGFLDPAKGILRAGQRPTNPPNTNIFKSLLLDQWNALVDTYCLNSVTLDQAVAEEKEALVSELKGRKYPFSVDWALLSKLKPAWLETVETPNAEQVAEAQKAFWIYRELLSVLAQAGIESLQKIALSAPTVAEEYTHNKMPLWLLRRVEINIKIDGEGTEKLLRALHHSAMQFRVIGIKKKNIQVVPEGTSVVADFLTFDEKQFPVELTLFVDHYDYLDVENMPEQEKDKWQGKSDSNSNNSSTSRRRSR